MIVQVVVPAAGNVVLAHVRLEALGISSHYRTGHVSKNTIAATAAHHIPTTMTVTLFPPTLLLISDGPVALALAVKLNAREAP